MFELCCSNVQPICAVLDCEDPESIPVALNMLRITMLLDEGTATARIGSAVTLDTVERADKGEWSMVKLL